MVLGKKVLLEKTPPPSFEFLIMGHDFPVRMSLLMTAFSFAKIKSVFSPCSKWENTVTFLW